MKIVNRILNALMTFIFCMAAGVLIALIYIEGYERIIAPNSKKSHVHTTDGGAICLTTRQMGRTLMYCDFSEYRK